MGYFYDILSELEQLLPVREVLIQQVETTPDEWITKETKADTRGGHLHEHGRGGEQSNRNSRNKNASQPESRRLLREGRSG